MPQKVPLKIRNKNFGVLLKILQDWKRIFLNSLNTCFTKRQSTRKIFFVVFHVHRRNLKKSLPALFSQESNFLNLRLTLGRTLNREKNFLIFEIFFLARDRGL